MKRLMKTGLAAAVAATAVLASPGTANAADGWTYSWNATVLNETMKLYKNDNLRVSATTKWDDGTYDEVIRLTDWEADGLGVRVDWYGDGRSGVCVNTKGNGETTRCDIHFAEGTWYYWRVCAKDGSVIKACTPYEPTRA